MPGAELPWVVSNLSDVPVVDDFSPRRFLTTRFTSFFLFTIFVFFFFSPSTPDFDVTTLTFAAGGASFNSVSKSLRNLENSSTSSRQSTFKMSSSLLSVADDKSCFGVSLALSEGAEINCKIYVSRDLITGLVISIQIVVRPFSLVKSCSKDAA